MKQGYLAAASVFVVALLGAHGAQAATVTAFGGSSSWQETDMRGAGTAEIVDVTGAGGNLETSAPLGSGVAKLTTGADNGDKAEVGIGGNFGTIADFLSGGTMSYSFLKQSAGDLNPSATAAIKLSVLDTSITTAGATDGEATFIFEPTWNLSAIGSGTGFGVVPTDDWLTADISGTSGIFWHTGIYGAGNMYGGPGMTLNEWNTLFNGDLASAVITSISVGVGTYNLGQTAYFDDVTFKSGVHDLAFDFEAPAVPVPAALPLMLSGFGALGFVGWRKRRQTAA